jgi:hypothetical protein
MSVLSEELNCIIDTQKIGILRGPFQGCGTVQAMWMGS